MPGLFRPRNLIIVGAVVSGMMFIPTPSAQSTNVFETQGSKNIGNRWSAGGGSDVHTPGAATKRGTADDTLEPQLDPKGIRSDHFKEKHSDQRPGEPGTFDKAWNKSHYGSEKGK